MSLLLIHPLVLLALLAVGALVRTAHGPRLMGADVHPARVAVQLIAGTIIMSAPLWLGPPEMRSALFQWSHTCPQVLWPIGAIGCMLLFATGHHAGITGDARNTPAGTMRMTSYHIGRAIYLLAMESWLRGSWLLDLAPRIGPWASALSSTAAYAVLHIRYGASEWVLCIPFGLLLCWCTLQGGSVWPAFLLHAALSAGYETGRHRRSTSTIGA